MLQLPCEECGRRGSGDTCRVQDKASLSISFLTPPTATGLRPGGTTTNQPEIKAFTPECHRSSVPKHLSEHQTGLRRPLLFNAALSFSFLWRDQPVTGTSVILRGCLGSLKKKNPVISEWKQPKFVLLLWKQLGSIP